MNPKLEGLVERFAASKGLEGDLPKKYEHFADNIILRDEYYRLNEHYPYESIVDKELLENINFGANDTESVDGFFCLIENSQGIIHKDTEQIEIEEWIKGKTNVYLKIILIQTKKGKLDTKNINDLNVILNSEYDTQENWKQFFSFRKILSELIKKGEHYFNVKVSIYYVVGANKDSDLLGNSNFTYKVDALKSTAANVIYVGSSPSTRLRTI